MDEKLQLLADKLGIATTYSDAGLKARCYVAEEETIRFFAGVLGYKANNDKEVQHSLRQLQHRRWQKALENVYVVNIHKVFFDAVVPLKDSNGDYGLVLSSRQTKEKFDVSFMVETTAEVHNIAQTLYVKQLVEITTPLEIGYYDAEFTVNGRKYQTVLAIAPDRCYLPDVLEKEKMWGYSIQLYSLKSRRNWGIGDFTDLANFVDFCGSTGADIIGLNPVNVLGHSFPEEASPYSSSSRLFLNPIYIDVEKVPEFEPQDIADVKEKIAALNASETILYGEVYPLKIKTLEKLYPRMLKDEKRRAAFTQFCREKGRDLENLATFQALYEDKWQHCWGGWRSWEKEYQSPDSAEIAQYRQQNEQRLGFFKFLQFEADRQLQLVSRRVAEKGLKIGIYRDLAVGVGRDSAEVWSDENVYLKHSGAGAPPDAFFPAGQKWNLGAFNPQELKERAYEPFIKIIRSAAEGAGALRLDHVMSLTRLYIIPEAAGKPGTYIMYPFEDMLNIVAIESHLNKCMIVGESIGNVPDGFIEKLQEKNIFSMSVLWSERWDAGWGDFKAPAQYPENAVTSVGTHDMAPLKMWWFGYDIALSRQLGIIPSDGEMQENYHKREADRWKLLKVLDENRVWPEDNPRHGDYLFGEAYPEGIEEAVHRLMAKTNAKIFLVQPEDVFQVDKLQNLPGTDRDKHPNWRRKLPVNIEDMENTLAVYRNVAAVKKER